MPQQITYYHVRVGSGVFVGPDLFYPNVDYWVLPDFYDNSQTVDGRAFKDVCVSAVQETQTFGG
jgi:hypothetical protein